MHFKPSGKWSGKAEMTETSGNKQKWQIEMTADGLKGIGKHHCSRPDGNLYETTKQKKLELHEAHVPCANINVR